ncbi:MAG: ATP-binding cassette domain-containing protein, partial [Bacteroidales bacterium]
MDKESLNFTNAFHRFQDTKEIVQNKDHQQEDLNGSIIKKDATIDVENLNVYIQNNHILKNISLKLYDKKITCIIGPSGCGKTTLLKSFNRMIDTTEHIRVEGSVIVDGENIYDNNAEITH